MGKEELTEILNKHEKWLLYGSGGERANLSEANLSGANLSGAILSRANLSRADLSRADLSRANLSGADLSRANLSGANLSKANLSGANLSGANLSGANLSGADLCGSNLSGSDLCGSNLIGSDLNGSDLSGAVGLLQTANFMRTHFEREKDGYIAYKTFNDTYTAPTTWKIEPGSAIEENVNFDRCTTCGSGINVAPLDWVKQNCKGEIWKVLIRWEWLCGVCVPYMTDGKIRCEKVELLEVVRDGT